MFVLYAAVPKPFATDTAFKGFFAGMTTNVYVQRVTTRIAFGTVWVRAYKRVVAGMGTLMFDS